jgi:hypothetical protein
MAANRRDRWSGAARSRQPPRARAHRLEIACCPTASVIGFGGLRGGLGWAPFRPVSSFYASHCWAGASAAMDRLRAQAIDKGLA